MSESRYGEPWRMGRKKVIIGATASIVLPIGAGLLIGHLMRSGESPTTQPALMSMTSPATVAGDDPNWHVCIRWWWGDVSVRDPNWCACDPNGNPTILAGRMARYRFGPVPYIMTHCMGGPEQVVPEECLSTFDRDGDGDIDLRDYAHWRSSVDPNGVNELRVVCQLEAEG